MESSLMNTFSSLKVRVLVAVFLIIPEVSFAETIWCKNLNIGCTTEAERAKAMRNCQMLADERYREALTESLANPSIWQLVGSRSAQDYASTRARVMKDICIKNSPELGK